MASNVARSVSTFVAALFMSGMLMSAAVNFPMVG